MTIKIPQEIKLYMSELINNGYEAYVIGGAIRDSLLSREPKDWDLFTNATGEQILGVFPNGKVMGGEERQEKILTVVLQDGTEVSQYRSNGDRTITGTSFDNHLATCDFTINSMSCDITGKIIDKYNGQKDLDKKVIRAVGECVDRFKEDKLRILRALRFKAKYNFRLTIDMMGYIQANIKLLRDLPAERVRDEFIKIMQYPKALEILYMYNFLKEFFPDMERAYNIEGGKWHDETVFDHMSMSHTQGLTLTTNHLLLIGIAFHDIGKPNKVDNSKGWNTFYKHQIEGKELMTKYMEELKFSKKDIKYVTTIINEHMFGIDKNLNRGSYLRHFARLDEAGVTPEELYIQFYCDWNANKKVEPKPMDIFLRENDYLQRYYKLREEESAFKISDMKFSGKDLIDLGLKPSPLFSKIINIAFEKVQNGELKNNNTDIKNYVYLAIKEGDDF